MAYHLDDALAAAIKALDEVVAPELTAANPLATEQLGLVIALLEFLRSRGPLLAARNARENALDLALAQALAELDVPFPDDVRTALAQAGRSGRAAAACSDAVRSTRDMDQASRGKVERLVVTMTKPIVELGCAWFAPFGFNGQKQPPIENLLSADPR